MPRVVWADFWPFDVACWDGRRIVLDRRLRGSPFLPHIIAHETEHASSRSPIDIHIELMDRKPRGFSSDMARRKPLSLVNFLVPFVVYRLRGRTCFGVEWSRCVFLAAFVGFALLEMKVLGVL